MFCVLPLLVLLGVSLETAASFLLFHNVAMLLREKSVSGEDWIWALYFYNSQSLLLLRGKRFQSGYKQVNLQYNTWVRQFYIIITVTRLHIITVIIVYTPNQGTNREKYFNHTIYQRERCRLWREINTLPSISSFTDHVFSIFRRKKYGSDLSEMDIKIVIPAPTQ